MTDRFDIVRSWGRSAADHAVHRVKETRIVSAAALLYGCYDPDCRTESAGRLGNGTCSLRWSC